MQQTDWFGITRDIDLHVWYERKARSWWAAYYEASETPAGTPIRWQVGDAWFGPSRDYVLIHRPQLTLAHTS